MLNNLQQMQITLLKKKKKKKSKNVRIAYLIGNKTADTVPRLYGGKITRSAPKTSITPMQTKNIMKYQEKYIHHLKKDNKLLMKLD